MANVSGSTIIDYTAGGWREYIQGKTSLNLKNMDLVDENILGLAEVLKENKTILTIDLSHNKLTSVGANALANALRINNYIATSPIRDTHVLNFVGNKFGKEGIFAIIKALDETNRYAHYIVFGEEDLSEEEAKELSETPELIHIATRTEEFRKTLYPSGDCAIS